MAHPPNGPAGYERVGGSGLAYSSDSKNTKFKDPILYQCSPNLRQTRAKKVSCLQPTFFAFTVVNLEKLN
jgi:hypothetical protein